MSWLSERIGEGPSKEDLVATATLGIIPGQAISASGLLDEPDKVSAPARGTQEEALMELMYEDLKTASEYREFLMPYMMEEMGFRIAETPEGVKSLERIPWEERLAGMDPQERKMYELHDVYLENQLKAARGELPVSPALEREQRERRGLVTEELSRRLGPQYMEGTAGIQAMGRLGEAELMEREAARRGLMREGEMLRGGMYGDIAQMPGRRMTGLAAAPQMYYGGIGPTATALQPYQFERGLQYQAGLAAQQQKAAQQAGLMQLTGTVAGAGMMAMSSRDFKEDIKETDTRDEENVLDLVKNGKTFTYNYKKGMGPKGRRIGLVTEHAPREVVTGGGKMLDIPQEVGMLRTAMKGLAKKVDRMEGRA